MSKYSSRDFVEYIMAKQDVERAKTRCEQCDQELRLAEVNWIDSRTILRDALDKMAESDERANQSDRAA